jgi:hypothetical protein
MQLHDVFPQVPLVFLHGHLIDARGGVFPQLVEGFR